MKSATCVVHGNKQNLGENNKSVSFNKVQLKIVIYLEKPIRN